MPFLFIGVCLLIASIWLMRRAVKHHEQEAIVGLSILIGASLLMIIFFGFVYTMTII